MRHNFFMKTFLKISLPSRLPVGRAGTMPIWKGGLLLIALWIGAASCAQTGKETRGEGPGAPAGDVRYEVRGPKKRIGILDFDVTGVREADDPRALAEAARDITAELLFKSGAFLVVERAQLDKVLAEQRLGQSGLISPQTAAQVGKLLGLQAVVLGKIVEYSVTRGSGGFGRVFQSESVSYHARVSLRMIDVTSGQVWAYESGVGDATDKSLTLLGGGGGQNNGGLGRLALDQAVRQMIGKLVRSSVSRPWQGLIAKVSRDGKIYINAGDEIGLPEGAILAARATGEEIVDPATNLPIGHEQGRVKGRIQVASHAGAKLSVCVASSGSGFATGDTVTAEDGAQ